MNMLILLLVPLAVIVAYFLGSFLWRAATDVSSYYYNVLFAGGATLLLAGALVATQLMATDETVFSNRLAIDAMQTFVSLFLLIVLYKKGIWGNVKTQLKEDRRYITLAAVMFLVGMGTGVVVQEEVRGIVEQSVEDLGQLADASEGKPWWQMGIILFGNNTRTAITVGLAIALVPLLGGIYALFAMVLNGAIVGVIGAIVNKPLSYLVVGIAPHGIFEIPAIIIAAAIGLKVNACIVRGITETVRKTGDGPEPLYARLREAFKSWGLMYLVIILLLVAAVIESTITPYLLDKII
ncbi:stage II sporulation protein M [archaeon]|nr:MAG: stage II sporulation protein M [archaeon]